MCLLGPAAEPNLWQEHNELARATVYLQDSVSHCRANAALNATSPVLISQIKRSTPLGTPVLVSRFTWALHPQSFHTFPTVSNIENFTRPAISTICFTCVAEYSLGEGLCIC